MIGRILDRAEVDLVPFQRNSIWGCSSVGRARGSHSRGQGFESPQLHQYYEGFSGLSGRFPFCHCDNLVTILLRSRAAYQTLNGQTSPLICHVSVALRDPKIGVAEQLCDSKRVDCVVSKSGCERMPQVVKAQFFDLGISPRLVEAGLDV